MELDLSIFDGDHARLSHSLAAFRSKFENADADGRERIWKYVDQLHELAIGRGSGFGVLSLHIYEESQKSEGDYMAFWLPVKILRAAMEAWISGEGYVPSLGDLCDGEAGAVIGMPEGY